MKFRIANWLDLNGPNLVWGIEAKAVDWTKWRPCLESGKPLVFDTWEAALDKMTEIELRDHTSSGEPSDVR